MSYNRGGYYDYPAQSYGGQYDGYNQGYVQENRGYNRSGGYARRQTYNGGGGGGYQRNNGYQRGYQQRGNGYRNQGYYDDPQRGRRQRRERDVPRSLIERAEDVKVDDSFDYDAADWTSKVEPKVKDSRVKTADVTKTKGSSFSDFSLDKRLLRGVLEFGFSAPSPVQEESIPHILMGRNVVCRAKNGTGKTGAYCIPLLQQMGEGVKKNRAYIQGLILVPTRELALQTARFCKQISKYMVGLNVLCTTGGTLLRDDILRLKQKSRPIHLVVATPGRLLDLASNGYALLGKCSMVVMDEADKLLSEDFMALVDKILAYIPKRKEASRQLLLYSATFPGSIEQFVGSHMPPAIKDGDSGSGGQTVYLNLMSDLTLRGITQFYAYVKEAQKVHCLFTLIKKLTVNQCIIFCRSMNRVELLARKITKLGFSCFYIHSKMTQSDRNRVFHQFREGKKKCRFLICTDLITRGIDVQAVNVVINFDFPKAAETYLHRIGRAGRFGHLAIAVNFVTDEDRKSLYQIEDDLETDIKPIPGDVEKIPKDLYCK